MAHTKWKPFTPAQFHASLATNSDEAQILLIDTINGPRWTGQLGAMQPNGIELVNGDTKRFVRFNNNVLANAYFTWVDAPSIDLREADPGLNLA